MHIDLNADVGEGFGRWTLGDDAALLDVITSANVACGFHAGDPTIMRRICEQAVARGVAIGAQVGYRDLAGFGRRHMDIAPAELTADILYQLGALDAFARASGEQVRYLKPHGALYNTAVVDSQQATAIVEATLVFDPTMPIVTLPGSALARLAGNAGIRVVAEAFPDRAYLANGRLMPRAESGAVLHSPSIIAARATEIARDEQVTALDGSVVPIVAASLCVHGDNPGAADIARAVRASLTECGIELRSFVL
jgi:UPF0271 protein